MPGNEDFIKKAFEAGLSADQVRSEVAERNQGQQAQQTPQQKKTGILPVLGRILDFPSSIMGGAIKTTGQYARGQYQAPELGSIGIAGKQQDIGELIHPGLVGAVRGIKERETVMNELPRALGIDPESGVGLATGLAGEIATPDILDILKLGDVAKTVFKKGGKVIKETGEKMLLKALKPSPSQITNFERKTGRKLVDFMTENKIVGNFIETVGSKIDELQTAFDDIALRSGKKVTSGQLDEAFDPRIQEFSQSVLKELKAKGADILAVKDELIQKFGKSANVADLTETRRTIDGLLSEGQFSLPPEQARYLRSVRDAIQESIQNATKSVGDLKKIGLDLRDNIEFSKIAEKQANVGKGANILGLIKPLATGTGARIAGVPGAIAGYIAGVASKSPFILSSVAKGLQWLGRGVEKSKVLPKTLEGLLRLGKEEVLSPTR